MARIRLYGRVRKTLLCLHVLASVGWFGAAALVLFAGAAAGATSDPTLPVALYRTIELSPWLTVPLGLVSATTGVLLGLGSKYGLVRYWWVVLKEVISLAVMVTDPLVVALVARNAVDSGTLEMGPVVAHVVLLTIATVLSVFKPRARTPLWTAPAR